VPDEPVIHEKCRDLVDEHRIAGCQVFDVRLVAIMLIAEINRIVTFNRAAFTRYGVAVLDPAAPSG